MLDRLGFGQAGQRVQRQRMARRDHNGAGRQQPARGRQETADDRIGDVAHPHAQAQNADGEQNHSGQQRRRDQDEKHVNGHRSRSAGFATLAGTSFLDSMPMAFNIGGWRL